MNVRHVRAIVALTLIAPVFDPAEAVRAQIPVSAEAQYGVVKTTRDLADPYPWGHTYSGQVALNATPFIGVVVGLSRTTFTCAAPGCSDNTAVKTNKLFAGPRFRWAYSRRFVPWIQLGMGQVTLEQTGEDVEFRDVSFTTDRERAYFGRAGVEVLLNDLIAVTASLRYEAWSVQLDVGDSPLPTPIPGPINGRLLGADYGMDVRLFTLDLGISINHGGRAERKEPERDRHPYWERSQRR